MNAPLILSWSGLEATLVMSMLSVAVLVALFFYLNRYTRRKYFTIWGTAWLFYALWLTLKLPAMDGLADSLLSCARLLCIETSAVFLLWGSFRFLGLKTPQTLMSLFLMFLYVWSFAAPHFFDRLIMVELPCFGLLGAASATAGFGFLRYRKQQRFVGASLLSAGFILWSGFLIAHPLVGQTQQQVVGMFLFSAAVQLFIAVSMIVLVLEEVRYTNESIICEVESVKAEREELLAQMRTSERQLRTLFTDATLKEAAQHAYEELRNTHRAVVEQERLSALGQVANGMAHDINNALTPVIGYSEFLIESEPSVPTPWVKPLKHIQKAGRVIEEIVGRMRRFSGGPSKAEPWENVDLNSTIHEIVEVFQRGCEEKARERSVLIDFAVVPLSELPKIRGIPAEIKEALGQLISNALDAMPRGGRIEIRSGLAKQDSRGTGSGGTALAGVIVSDTGTGMDQMTRGRCIEPFFSTKKHGSSGLGLAIVYGTMQRHQGELRIESEESKGTTVSLFFPIAPAQHCAEPEPAMLRPGAPMRILCIDDEPLIRQLFQDTLGMFGHHVEVADGGRAGIDAFRDAEANGDSFDVVITDLGMPDVDGREVIQALKYVSASTPIVLVTGWATLLEPGDAMFELADAVLKKPLSMTQLQAVLQRLVRSHRQDCPNSTTRLDQRSAPMGSG